MAKSVKVDDITKLNPALLEISEAEIDRRITELMMARECAWRSKPLAWDRRSRTEVVIGRAPGWMRLSGIHQVSG